jgi:hypothetical protein
MANRFGTDILIQAGHVGLGPSLVDEDKPRRIELGLMALPAFTPPCDVGPVLLRGVCLVPAFDGEDRA